jgi:hypothetical protein
LAGKGKPFEYRKSNKDRRMWVRRSFATENLVLKRDAAILGIARIRIVQLLFDDSGTS